MAEEAFHIFVVDDEKIISETLATILRIHGFAATSFTNPLECSIATKIGPLSGFHSLAPLCQWADSAMRNAFGFSRQHVSTSD